MLLFFDVVCIEVDAVVVVVCIEVDAVVVVCIEVDAVVVVVDVVGADLIDVLMLLLFFYVVCI